MSHRFPADPQVHLHWVQETPSRGLALPVSQTLNSLEALPPCAQNAVRATGLAEVELHIPPYRPSVDLDLGLWLSGLRFRQDAAGRISATHSADVQPIATAAFHQAMVLTLRAVTGDATPLTLLAETPGSQVLPQPLATRYTCAERGGLANAPSERSHHYDRVYKTVSVAAQAALRATVPSAHITDLSQFDDRPHTLALLAWSAAPAIAGRHVDQLGVDVLNAALLERAQAAIPRRLLRRLSEVWELLGRHEIHPTVRRSYHPDLLTKTVERLRNAPQFLHLLFANELRLITAFIRYCVRIPTWREEYAASPSNAYREARLAWEELEVHFRWFYQKKPHPAIGSYLLLETARTLEAID